MLASSALLAFLLFSAPLLPAREAFSVPSEPLFVRKPVVTAEQGGGVDFAVSERDFFRPEKTSDSLGPVLSAVSAIAVDRRSGAILFAKDPHAVRAPASITKTMTALVALESGLSLDGKTVVSREAAEQSGAAMRFEEGDQLSNRDLLVGMLVASGNDAATQLAITTAGSQKDFVDRMNARVADLGLYETAFKNPTGLDADGHRSSAADLARIFDTALQQPAFTETIQITTKDIPVLGKETSLNVKTTNELLREHYPRIIGGKTGFTDNAGECLVVLASDNDGNETILVILGSSSSDERFHDMKALATWIYGAYTWKKPIASL